MRHTLQLLARLVDILKDNWALSPIPQHPYFTEAIHASLHIAYGTLLPMYSVLVSAHAETGTEVSHPHSASDQELFNNLHKGAKSIEARLEALRGDYRVTSHWLPRIYRM
jgi:hypothetical protein